MGQRHRKLILSGFGPTLTNAKLRTPQLMIAKIKAWWHFVVEISKADPLYLNNDEMFSKILAPLITLITGNSISFDSNGSIDINEPKFQQSDVGKSEYMKNEKSFVCIILY